MSNDNIKNLLTVLNNRPIVIWGARMTGIGFFHLAKKHHLNIIGFVDSDPSLNGMNLYNLPITLPGNLSSLKAQYQNLVIVVAVSIKEDEIIDSLNEIGLSSKDYVIYKDFCEYFFTIDIAGTCNLKCPSCANSISSNDYPKGFMSLDDFKNITDKIIKEVSLVSHFCLYNWGEPLLHPQLDLFINHVHQIGIAVAVSTNLSINSADQIYKMVKASPDILKISLSGYYPDTYNKTHTGGDINLVKSNLYRLKYYMEICSSSFIVEVNYHLYKHNIGIDLTKMRELCKELNFVFSTYYANFTPVERVIKYCQGNNIDKETKEFLKLFLVSIDKGLEITKPFHHLPCRFLSNQININWDRSVSLCCVSYGRQTVISNDFLQDSLESIKIQKKNRDICKICMGYGIPQYLLGVNQKEWKKEADYYIA
jgi:MoaA/NifB/PqqE/SkfB family radical SAM enzyme